MATRPGLRDSLWVLPGAATLILVLAAVLYFHSEPNPGRQLASRTKRLDLVSAMETGLASASEAEKSSVLAIADRDSQTYADQARKATAEVERRRHQLEEMPATDDGAQREALARFTEAFERFRRLDDDLLALAVENTNLKAYEIAYGPVAKTVDRMNAALSDIAAAEADSADATMILKLAYDAEIAALRIETLLPPHIAEASDARMDEMETLMTKEDRRLQKDLAGLAARLGRGARARADLAKAKSEHARFSELCARILPLSRKNTNVRSLALSLGDKRKVLFECLDDLTALKRLIQEEPIAGVTYGRPVKPR